MAAPHQSKAFPGGMGQWPFDPTKGRYLEARDLKPRAFTIVEAHEEAVLCTDGEDREVLVAKAREFRSSEFDGVEIGSTTYASVSDEVRTASFEDADSNAIVATEVVYKPYEVGQIIVGMLSRENERMTAEFDGKAIIADWEEVNTTGRFWKRYPILATIVSEVGSGVYTYTEAYGGTGSGTATEMNLSLGILADTLVMIHEGLDGRLYFFFPVEEC